MRLKHAKTSPEDYKHQIVCEWCLELFGAKRSTSKFCSCACRQGRYRAEKRKRETGSYN